MARRLMCRPITIEDTATRAFSPEVVAQTAHLNTQAPRLLIANEIVSG